MKQVSLLTNNTLQMYSRVQFTYMFCNQMQSKILNTIFFNTLLHIWTTSRCYTQMKQVWLVTTNTLQMY
jgi:hypothetical protein